MERRFTEQELKGINNFLVEVFGLTEEQNLAIDRQIPMTQEIYDSILDRCTEIGSDAEELFFRMLSEYPEFMCNYADELLKEVENADIDLPEPTPEEHEFLWQELCEKIRAQYGEDAI